MRIDLSKAYKLLNDLDLKADRAVLDTEDIENEINVANDGLKDDLDLFSQSVNNIQAYINDNDIIKAKSEFVKLAVYVGNIETNFSNFSDEIQRLIQKSPLFEDVSDLK